MRWLVGALAVLVVFTAPADAARKRCPTRGNTVIANGSVRVYRVGPPGDADYRACLIRTGRTRLLVSEGGGAAHESAGSFRLVGRYVAYTESFCVGDDCRWSARTVDMRRNRVIRKVTGNSGGPGDLELARSGSFALFSSLPDDPNLYLSVVEADGQHLVDSGPDIDPTSLAIAGGWVYWSRAGEPRSTRIR